MLLLALMSSLCLISISCDTERNKAPGSKVIHEAKRRIFDGVALGGVAQGGESSSVSILFEINHIPDDLNKSLSKARDGQHAEFGRYRIFDASARGGWVFKHRDGGSFFLQFQDDEVGRKFALLISEE